MFWFIVRFLVYDELSKSTLGIKNTLKTFFLAFFSLWKWSGFVSCFMWVYGVFGLVGYRELLIYYKSVHNWLWGVRIWSIGACTLEVNISREDNRYITVVDIYMESNV